MKRTLITLAIVLATASFAQPAPRGPHGGPDPVQFLNLTADQKTQWDALHEQLHATVQPLVEQKRSAEEQLHSLIDAASPNPTAIGNQMLAIKTIDQQIKAAHDATAAKIEAFLTADQKVKFEALRALQRPPHGGPRP
jgi:Spy/CpxP family protein refolding chaperone